MRIRLNGPRRRVDLASIVRQSDWAREYRRSTEERARDMAEDPRRGERLAAGKCLVCFYCFESRIGGARLTAAQCGICQAVLRSGSTAIDVVCLDCGRDHDICVRCGGDVRMRIRRDFDQSAVLPDLGGEG